jgi:hypothetical protein
MLFCIGCWGDVASFRGAAIKTFYWRSDMGDGNSVREGRSEWEQ